MIKDNFSEGANNYKKYRPIYPESLYQIVLDHTKRRQSCWDCGTGNGQVAMVLSKHFRSVEATDISEKQIAEAVRYNNINYTVSRAAQTNFATHQFDLITAAQAAHWFEMDHFISEVRRVGKPGATIAIWGYKLLKITEAIDLLVNDFYINKIGPYWDGERKHVDKGYLSLPFPFQKVQNINHLYIENQWTIEDLEGYLNTWSSVKHFKKRHPTNPVPELINEVRKYWKDETLSVQFPLFLRIGYI